MSKIDLLEYFNEHVVYELLMLRYSKDQLGTIRIVTREDQLLWNAMFAAFNVSARNLYDFMTGDQHNISVTDYRSKYCPTFESPNVSFVSGTLQMLNAQCFHMGQRRSKDAANKVTHKKIVDMYDWVESNMVRLIASFGDGFKIDFATADWSPSQQPISSKLGPTGPFLRALAVVESATTSTGSGISYTVNPPKVVPSPIQDSKGNQR